MSDSASITASVATVAAFLDLALGVTGLRAATLGR